MLLLTSLLPETIRVTCGIINDVLDTSDPETNYQNDPANASWVLGSCLRTLATHQHNEWARHANLILWTGKVLQRWAWSDVVLGGLAEVIRRR